MPPSPPLLLLRCCAFFFCFAVFFEGSFTRFRCSKGICVCVWFLSVKRSAVPNETNVLKERHTSECCCCCRCYRRFSLSLSITFSVAFHFLNTVTVPNGRSFSLLNGKVSYWVVLLLLLFHCAEQNIKLQKWQHMDSTF